MKWEDVMKGPSREAVLAHTYKVLHYRELFGEHDAAAQAKDPNRSLDEMAQAAKPAPDRYAAAA